MKTISRTRLGAVVFLGSGAIGLAIQWSGFGFIGYASGWSPMFEWHQVSVHWPVIPVGLTAVVGLLCWLLPQHNGMPKVGE